MSRSPSPDGNQSEDEVSQSDDTLVMPLSFLCKLITPFNGDRDEVENFLLNAKHAHDFAQPNQIVPLFAYTLAQISSSVKNRLNLIEVTNFEALKISLRRLYVDQTHYTQLMEDLDTIKQRSNETITEYYTRLDKLTCRCLSALKSKNDNPDLLNGKLAFIKDTALRRFIFHSNPEISRVLRIHTSLDDLNKAYSIAISEEKAIFMYKKSHVTPDTKYCKNCKVKTHNTRDCRSSKNRPNYEHNNSANERNYTNKFCRYCKTKGHEISDCFKKKQNDERRNAQNPSNPRVNHLNSQMSNLSVVELDNSIKSTQTSVQMLN